MDALQAELPSLVHHICVIPPAAPDIPAGIAVEVADQQSMFRIQNARMIQQNLPQLADAPKVGELAWLVHTASKKQAA